MKSESNAHLFFAMCVVILALPKVARAADELEMRNGSRLQGTLISESPDALTFDAGGAVMKIDPATVQAISANGVRRELSAPVIAANKNAAPATAAVQTSSEKVYRTLAEAPVELRRKLIAMLEEAKKTAREKLKIGLEKALAKHPGMSPEMAALMRSQPTQDSWLKVIVDGALKRNELLLDPKFCLALWPDYVKQGKTTIEMQYERSCLAISTMRETDDHGYPTGLEGDAFIDDYVSQALANSKGVLPPDKSTADKSGIKHRRQINDTSGISQIGGN